MEGYKNYYSNEERKFTFLKLEVRALSRSDILIIVLFGLPVIIQLVLYYFAIYKFSIGLLFFITFLACCFILTSPLGVKFRSLYFSIIWLIISIFLLLNSLTIARAPLYCFLLYHTVRLVFWYKYDREFIPYEITRGKMLRYVSKIEGRGGYKQDKVFMLILALLGFVTFMYCLSGLIGVDIAFEKNK